MNRENQELRMLKKLLAGLDPKDIYRSVYGPKGEMLAEGLEPLKQQLMNDFRSVDFHGKTVVDLGCNFGLFSFLAAECGACRVTGVDALPLIVEGAQLLARIRGEKRIDFITYDFERRENPLGSFDIVMLVDFFGKSNIRKQKVESIISFMQSIAKNELLFAIRPMNRIEKDLKMSVDAFRELYPGKYIQNGSFSLLNYIEDVLGKDWRISSVSPYDGKFYKHKLLFTCHKTP